jgi:hypothetical protein
MGDESRERGNERRKIKVRRGDERERERRGGR